MVLKPSGPAAAAVPSPIPPRVVGREQVRLVVLALTVGVGAGLGAVAFRYMIKGFTELLSGHADYSDAGRSANHLVPFLGAGFVVLAPVVAGLVYGPMLHRFAPEARGHGVPEVMLAVARNGGRIRPQVAVVKSLASALCIGGGGSVGREGPIVQIGSALGSSLGQVLRLGEERVRLLVACGAAGGIAATFNAPLAGVFFAMELILVQWASESFGMVVISSVTASVIARAILGNATFLSLPTFRVDHVAQYPLFAALGVLAGVLGVGFARLLYAIEDACDWVWRGPASLRPAVGGLVLGLLLLALPQMYGVGYPVLGNAVGGAYGLAFLCVLLLGKMVACSLTIGIGGSGGVFAPSLFCGAMVGAAFGSVLHDAAPSIAGSPGAYALVGMGAFFAGAARAPITAVVILFELTGEYSIILPLMLAIVLATGVSHLVSHDTIYTRKLLRRGVDLDERAGPLLSNRRVSEVMAAVPDALPADATPRQAAARFATTGEAVLPVLDSEGCVLGTLAARVLMDALAAGDHDALPALTDEGLVDVSLTVAEALEMLDAGFEAIGVVADGRLLGWVGRREILRALS